MKKSLLKISVVLGLLLVVLALVLTISNGFSSSNTLTFIGGLGLLLLGLYYDKLSRSVRRLVLAAIVVGACYSVVVLTIVISQGSRNTTTFTEDAVVVLGAGIRGERPTRMLIGRLDRCVEYMQKNPNAVVVLSGGQGRGEDIPEAEAMARYLISKGVNPAKLIQDDKSKDTYENLVNTRAILDSCFNGKSYTLACITNDFHLYRSLRIGRLQGVDMTCYGAPVPWYLRPGAYLREICSVTKHWVYR